MKYKIIVDKQSRTNPSNEKKEYIIDIEELRYKGNIEDTLVFTVQEAYVMRRLKLSEYQVLTVLDEPIKEPLIDADIKLFEGENYIYILDETGNKFYAEYIVRNEFNNLYVTHSQMNSKIEEKVGEIELSVHQTLNGYSTKEELKELKSQTIVGVDVEYALGDSSTVAPETGWNTNAPTWENGKYMWQRTVTTYADGTQKTSDATCITGANGQNGTDGKGIKKIEEQYYLSTSDEKQIEGEWKETQDTWQSGKYIWTRSKITWTDDNVTYTTPVLATGINNANSTAQGVKDDLKENYLTTVDIDSKLDLKAGDILAEVALTYATGEDLSSVETTIKGLLELKIDKKNLVSELNASADIIKMKAGTFIFTGDNFSIDEYGNITATGGTIGGFALSSTDFSGKLNGIYNYDLFDAEIAMYSSINTISLPSIAASVFDLNNDGYVDTRDASRILSIISGEMENTKRVSGVIKINSTDPKRCFTITKDDEICVSLGVGGINSNLIATQIIICGTTKETVYDNTKAIRFNGMTINSDGQLNIIEGTNGGNQVTTTLNKNELILRSYDSYSSTIVTPTKIEINGRTVLSALVLYDNPSGTTGTVSLTSDITNFSKIEIFYKDDWENRKSDSIYNPTYGQAVQLLTCRIVCDSNSAFVRSSQVVLNGTTITKTANQCACWSSWNNEVVEEDNIYIYKVIGYK